MEYKKDIKINHFHLFLCIFKFLLLFIVYSEACCLASICLYLWDSVKAVLRGRFTAIQAYLKKQEKNQINHLTLYLKQLQKDEMKNPRVSRRKEIIKIRAGVNEKQTKETIVKINKAKSWFFEKINKIDKPVDSSRKKGEESNQQN